MVPAQAGNPLIQMIPFALMGLIFYFIVLLPEKKKKEAHNQSIAKLQKNDTVVTAGGIHATVVNIKEKTLILRIDDNVKIEVDREAITTIHAKSKD
jgi:preprotein translocase subunit YajC